MSGVVRSPSSETVPPPSIGEVGGRSVVLAYGSVAAEYEALHTNAAAVSYTHLTLPTKRIV